MALPAFTSSVVDVAFCLRSGSGVIASALVVLAWTVLGLAFRRREVVLVSDIILTPFLFSAAFLSLVTLYMTVTEKIRATR